MLKQVVEHLIGYAGLFSLDHVVAAFPGFSRTEVKHRLDRLESEGLIKRFREKTGRRDPHGPKDGPPPREITYVKCKGLEKRLEKMTAAQKTDTATDKIWRTVRLLRRFTRGDLVTLTGASEDSVRDYTRLLKREGFIRPLNSKARPITWSLAKDPGPQRPRIPYERKANG
jgi:hypothetical protein